jgi:hypothetical protein
VNIDHLLGGRWPVEYEEKMVNYVQEEEEEDDPMRKVSSTPSGGLSPILRRGSLHKRRNV